MNTKAAFIINTNPDATFRPGESAEIIGVTFVSSCGLPARPCYRTLYKDGFKDFVAISDTKHYQILSEDDIKERVTVIIEGTQAILNPTNKLTIFGLPQEATDSIKKLATTAIWMSLLNGSFFRQT